MSLQSIEMQFLSKSATRAKLIVVLSQNTIVTNRIVLPAQKRPSNQLDWISSPKYASDWRDWSSVHPI